MKKIDSIMSHKVFEIQKKRHMFEEIWQYVPLHWLYCVKHDLRHKARLVMGGHVTDATGYDKYEATIKTENLRLQLFLAARKRAEGLGGDIGSTYLCLYS